MRRFIQIVLILLLLTAAGGSWYLYRKGFSRSWREWVVGELRDHGVEVSFGTLAVEPFRGLVARDVKLYDGPSRRRVVARIDEMVVEANYAHAIRSEPFLEALTLVDASLKLPLDPTKPDGPSVGIEKLNTRLLFRQDDVTVSRLEALVAGMRVSASGQLAHLSKRALSKPPPGAEQPPLLLRALAELQQVRHDGPPTQVNIRFSGDLTDLNSVVLEVDIAAEKAHRNDYYIDSLAVSAVWKDRTLTFPRFDLRDAVGRLQLSLSHDLAVQRTEWHLRSSVDLPALARAFGFDTATAAATGGIDLRPLKFQSIPEVEFTGRGSVEQGKPKWLVFGRVSLGHFAYDGVPFDRFHADISSDGRRWALRDFVLRPRNGGELRGDAQQDYAAEGQGDFRLGLTSTINPEALAPLLTKMAPKVGERLALLRFYEAPRLTLSARGPSPLDSVASGDVVIGRAAYRGMEAQSAKASLRYDGRVLYVDDFFIRRAEGTAAGSMAFNFRDELAQFKVRCNVIPIEVALWVDPSLINEIKPYRFGRRPPALVIDGIVDQRRPGLRTHLQVSVDAPVMTYEFSGKDLHLSDVTAKLSFTDEVLKIADLRADLYGGTVAGDAQVSLQRAKPGHTADIKITDVDFTSLTKLYFDYDESAGKLNATYHFSGIRDDARTMKGEGELEVTEGNVFAIPFLGPLSDILNKIVPGMGYNKARRASAPITIADGIISTKNLVIEGRGFSMIGDGRVWFLEDRMDFDMRINAQGLPGVLLFPVSKLLEVRAVSKFSKPEWRPKVMPGRRPTEKPEKPEKIEKPERPRVLSVPPTPPR